VLLARFMRQSGMTVSRRFILGLVGANLAVPMAVARAQSADLQQRLDTAARAGRPLILPPETVRTMGLRLPDGAHLVGHPGRTRLVSAAGGPVVQASGTKRITLEGVTFAGDNPRSGRDATLAQFQGIETLSVQDCGFEGFGGIGLRLNQCGGRIRNSRFADLGRSALFSTDSLGLLIEGNVVRGCGENGLLVWRSTKGYDGSILRDNRIETIRADAGGTGQFGNGIGLYRAGGIVASGNVIRRVAYTAIRNNGGSNVIYSANQVSECGEVALYSEFAFDGAVITGNIIDGGMMGIEVTNFADHGGKLASVTGNIVRNIRQGKHPGTGTFMGGAGIFVEGEGAISGNVVERAARTGLQLGWGPSLKDISATGNTILRCGHGIEVSVAPEAGFATITGNVIAEVGSMAIVGKRWHDIATGDLTKVDPSPWPRIKLSGNTVR
jgi:uncharacterized secreted repeat protein (TIGR03808 family)